MPQKLTPEMLEAADVDATEESIPTLEGAKSYFALVEHQGKRILCIMGEDGNWRATSYQEMMGLM